MRLLIENGVDANAAGATGLTALHVAACRSKAEAVDGLIYAGADIDTQVVPGDTPLHFAARTSDSSPLILVLLKHGASVGEKKASGQSPLHAAASTAKAGEVETAEVVDLLLRHGAAEKAIDNDSRTPADMIGTTSVQGQDRLAEDAVRVLTLLANAPADRAWRRLGFLVLCGARYPSGKVLLRQVGNHTIAKRTRSRTEASRVEVKWAVVANMLMGVGADAISLMGDGADLIFEAIVGFL